MRSVSLAHLTMVQVSPPDLVAIAGRTGYDFVGLRLTEVTGGDAWPIITDRQLLKATLQELAASGVGVLDVELIRLRPETEVSDFKPVLDTAAELGAKHVLTQGHDAEWNRLVENYSAFCDLAASYGMTSDVEFLTWTGMRGLSEANQLVEAAGRENAGIMIDTLHFARSGCRPEDIDEISPSRFRFVQLADAAGPAPTTTEGLIFTAREDRLFPGEGDLDLRTILAHLPSNIPVAVEIPNSALAARMTNEQRAAAACEATRNLLAEVVA